jgi:uncharacterized OB-fold protein
VSEPAVTLKAFFERAREGRLTGIRCSGCGEVSIPPKEFCAACGTRAWEPVTLSGDGTLASYTIIRVAPARHAADAPYAVAVVRLDQDVQLLGRIVDIPLDHMVVGLRVRFRPLTKNGQTAIGFGPA